MNRQIGPRLAAFLLGVLLAGCARESPTAAASNNGLLSGIGSVNHPISTANREARKFFNQGLALVYGFNFPEAVKSFQRAAELDPKSPMPYWGMAVANGPNYNAWTPTPERREASRTAIRLALARLASAPEAEKAYVNAAAECFLAPPRRDPAETRRDCADAMRGVYQDHPDDPDAAVLFAASLMDIKPWHLWTVDGKPGPDTPEIVRVLEGVLRRWPDHLGANHMYIHAMEASPTPGRALASAHRLETLAPSAGHLVHMPSHIYMRTGDYAAAVKCNQRAEAADDAYENSQPAEQTAGTGYFRHNLAFLAAAANMDGEYQVAADAAAKLQTHAHSGAFVVMPMVVRLRFGKWDELIALPEPNGEVSGVAYFWRFARGFAYASEGKADEAAGERKRMAEEYGKLPAGRAFAMYFNDWNAINQLAGAALDARIAGARGDRDGAIRLWERAAGLEDRLNFDDMPDWYYPVRESWGAALLRAGRAAQAEQVFREDLRRNPRNPRSLFGLAKALEAEKKGAEARQEMRGFETAWKGAGPPRLEDY